MESLDYMIHVIKLLDHIIDSMYSHDEFINLDRNLHKMTHLLNLIQNAIAPREMLNTGHSNQDPATERLLLVKTLNENFQCILAETFRMVDQRCATENAVASNLNMGMALSNCNRRLEAWELDFISKQLNCCEFNILSQNLRIGTPVKELVRQYHENKHACSEILNTWHSNQDPAKARRLMTKALRESRLLSLAETVLSGECRRTVPQGMSTVQHDATGNAVVSNLNTGMALFDLNTPLDALELKLISEQLDPNELLLLSTSTISMFHSSGGRLINREGAFQMLCTWHSNQDPAKERGLLMQAFKENGLDSLAETVRMGIWSNLPHEPFHKPILSCRRKRTLTQTVAGHETNTPGASQPSSAPYLSRPKVRAVANPPQQPDTVPMRIPQQTSDEITEIKLRDVSIKLGGEWRTVGTFLGFGNSQIEVMQEEYRVVKECIFQMLLQWRNTNGVEATKKKLKKALRRSLREDLADFIDEADD